MQEPPGRAIEMQNSLDAVSAQAAGLQAQLEEAQEALSSSRQQLAAAAGRETELRSSAVLAQQEGAAAAAQAEALRAQVRELEGDCEALQSTVEELHEACEVQSAARAEAEEQSAQVANTALQTLQSKLEQVWLRDASPSTEA